MDWHQPATIAPFVTYRNPDISRYATYAAQLVDNNDAYKRDLLNGIAIPVSGSVTGSFSIAETKASVINEIEKINKTAIDFLETKLGIIIGKITMQGNDSIKAYLLNSAGIIEVRLGKHTSALKKFNESIEIKNSSGTQSNIAATKLLCGETQQAFAIFDSLFRNTRDVKIGINRAICLFSQANTKEKTAAFITAMKDVSGLLHDHKSINSYFGILLSDNVQEKGFIENNSAPDYIIQPSPTFFSNGYFASPLLLFAC